MNEAKLSKIMLVLLLIGMLTWVFNVQQVKGVGTVDGGVCTVVIRADGSVDPPTAPIQRHGSIYTLTSNITCGAFSDGIVIERDDMILDGAGYTLQGISGSEAVGGAITGIGITVSGRSNVTIQNITITKFSWGIILVESAFNNRMVRNVIADNGNIGIQIDHSSNNTLLTNHIAENNLGILICASSNNRIYHNNFIDNNQQVYATTPSYANFWDDGYPSGGNYWSDYVVNDTYSGLGQDVKGSDGIGDVPYFIDERNLDCYPLMEDPPLNPSPDPPNPSPWVNPLSNPPSYIPVGGTCTYIHIPGSNTESPTPHITLASTILAAVAIAICVTKKRKTYNATSCAPKSCSTLISTALAR